MAFEKKLIFEGHFFLYFFSDVRYDNNCSKKTNRNDYYLKEVYNNMKKALLLFLVTVLALFTAACGDKSSTTSPKQSESKEKMTIYTTVYPLSYFTQRIGGDFVEVSSIYPAGANEHTFEPTQKDMMKLADADLFFYVGLGLEGFVENAKKTLAKEDVTMIATADHVSDEKLAISTGHTHADEEDHAATEEEHSHSEDEHGHDNHDHGNVDPHVWLSPIISQDLALSIKDTLIEKNARTRSYIYSKLRSISEGTTGIRSIL